MSGATTRRQISVNWTYALNQRIRPPQFSASSKTVELPAYEYLPDKYHSFVATLTHQRPSNAFLIKRTGFSDVVLAYDDAIAPYAATVSAIIEDLLGNSEAYQLDQSFQGSGRNANEAIIIYLNSDISTGIAAGHYLDLDGRTRGMRWSSGGDGGINSIKGEGTNADYDFIEVRRPTENGVALPENLLAGGYIKTVIHEIFHRQFGSHEYNELYANYSSDTAKTFLTPYTIDRAISDPVYARTRDVLVKMYSEKKIAVNGKIYGDEGAPSPEAYRRGLELEDQGRLKGVQEAADLMRLSRLYVGGVGNGWADLTIEELKSAAAAGEFKVRDGGSADNRSDYALAKAFDVDQFRLALGYLQDRPGALRGDLTGLSAEVANLAVQAMTAGPGGYVCGTVTSGANNSQCISLRDKFKAAQTSSFSPNALVLRRIDATSLTFAIGNDGSGKRVIATINAQTATLDSFQIDGRDILDVVDASTRRLLDSAVRMARRIGQANSDPSALAQGLALPIKLEHATADDGSIITTVIVDLGVVQGKTGLKSRISALPTGQAVKITERVNSSGQRIVEREELFSDKTVKINIDGIVSLRFKDSSIGVDFVDAGSALGSVLGSRLAGSNQLAAVLASGSLKTIGANLGDIFNDALFSKAGQHVSIEELLKGIDKELANNILSSGIGAVSSFISATLVQQLGVNGIVGEIATTATSATIGQIITNLTKLGQQIPGAANGQVFKFGTGVDFALIGNAVGALLGGKLAAQIISFDTVGGQIGSAVGTSLGTLVAGKVLGDLLAGLGAFGGPLGAAIGAFVGFILGGLIGSLFGGTPRSGADAVWNDSTQRFEVANAYSRKGGSKDAAVNMATAAADTFNVVLDAVGGTLLKPTEVQTGNYGMRKSDFVYRPTSTQSEDAITARFKGKNAASNLINYGVYQGLSDPDFIIAGGDTFVKRALYNTISINNGSNSFSGTMLIGNLNAAKAYAEYTENREFVASIVAAEPDSVFAAETALMLVRAAELGLTKRHGSDWYGGFSFLVREAETSVTNVQFGFDYNPAIDQISRVIGLGGYLLGDAIDVGAQTTIEGSAGNDVIQLTHVSTARSSDGFEYAVTGGTDRLSNATGLVINGQAGTSAGTVVDISAIIDAGAGDDIVFAGDLGNTVFGGAGNDTLYGGRLDDWLLGGDGNDTLDAGAQGGGLGGDGNYLEGGAGDDILRGREGSDWLEGGDGADQLWGGDGDDILAGGAGAGDQLRGGSGGDQYIVRRGDGADLIEEQGSSYSVGGAIGDMVAARMAAIEKWKANPLQAGALRPDWVGTSAGISQGKIDGGDDAVVFGDGIEIGDVRLQRSSVNGVAGGDLIITITEIGEDGLEHDTDTVVTLRNWFTDSFQRVEWLKFADGNELRIGDVTSFVIGGAGNDVLIGTNGRDFIYGGAGDDELRGLAGDDIANGGTGNDFVSGDDDNDLVIGGLGNDQLLGGKGNDAVTGDAGTDMIYGGDGADTLAGGTGDGDVVVGGAGDDRFKYARGDGRDTIFDDYVGGNWVAIMTGNTYATGVTEDADGTLRYNGEAIRRLVRTPNGGYTYEWIGRFDYDTATHTLRRYRDPGSGAVTVANNGTDTLEFAPGIDIQDVILRQVGTDLVLAIGDDAMDIADTSKVADSITIKDWYVSGLTGQIEKMVFYQTGILDTAANKRTLIAGDDTANTLAGTNTANWITGGAGDDLISGGLGDDILAGNSGSDTLRGEAGNDVLYGGTGNDILDGGAGKDILIGGSGIDIASYASATAAVRAFLSAAWSNSGDAIGDEYTSIEGLTGSAGNDTLGGDADQNELAGGQGSDTLLGNAGDDTYVWNAVDGSDTVYDAVFVVEEAVTTAAALASGYSVASWASTGVAASGGTYWRLQIQNAAGEIVYDYDKFVKSGSAPAVPTPSEYVTSGWKNGFARTSGQQVTRQKYDTAIDAGVDTLEFGAGLSLTDVQFLWSGNDLFLRKDGTTTHQVKLQGQKLAANRIETLQLADGLSVSLTSVLVAASTAQLNGTAGDDLLAGRYGNYVDTLSGGDGNDVLVGYAGDDILSGGLGNDVFEGGLGADRLDGGGNAAIGSATDAGDTARYVRSSEAVTVDLNNGGAQAGGDAAGDVLIGIENLVGSAFGDTLTGDAGGNRLAGLDGNDTLRGNGGDDVLLGDGGDDALYGGDGVDALAGGDGADQLWGGNDDDRLDGGDGDDLLYGEAGKDTLTAGAGNDTLDGGAGDDTLSGDAGNDTLSGGDGNDTLSGGLGSDSLSGGAGDDSYVFSVNSGVDQVVDASGINLVSFDQSVSFARLWMTQSGNDLKIAVIGGDAVVTLSGFFTGGTVMRAVQTTTHAYYLDNADSRRLIDIMTEKGAVPSVMPAEIAAKLAEFWHEGGKAAPTAPATPRSLSTMEDAVVAVSAGYGVIDHDGGAVVYSVSTDKAPALGTISNFDATTGSFTYTPRANINGLDAFSLIATDADGQSVELRIEMTVQAVNDIPTPVTVVGGGALSVAESGSNSLTTVDTVVGSVTSTDADGDPIVFTLNDPGDRFYITATGEIRVKTPTAINYETQQAHAVTVTASDGNGGEIQTSLTINVTDINESNAVAATASFAINENVAVGTTIGTVTATDPDGAGVAFGQQRYYFKSGTTVGDSSSDGRYIIDALTGAIRTKVVPNYEAGTPVATYQVVARDNAGNAPFNEASSNVTITVNNVNEQNTLPSTYTLSIAENVATGTLAGTIAASDPDGSSHAFGQQRYYFLNGSTASATSSDGRFTINATTGKITSAVALNYEAGPVSATYTVIARDNAGASGYKQAQSAVTIKLTDVNEANSLPASYAAMSVAENLAAGTAVGTVTATDLDGAATTFGTQRYYFLNGTTASATSADGKYAINATTGAITTAAVLNYEAAASSTYTVIARDNAGGTGYNQAQTSLTINVVDVNEANALPASHALGVTENVATGTTVGKVTASDPDGPSTVFGTQRYYFVYNGTISATSFDGRYAIDAASGTITTAANIDYEAGASTTYAVIARDNAGAAGYFQAITDVTIAVTNVNEANSLSVTPISVAENVAVGTVIGTIAASDLDSSATTFGQQRYYFWDGTNATATSADGRYAIDAISGQVKTATVPNFESGAPATSYTVIARDNAGTAPYNQAQATLSVNVTDINEAPTDMTWSPGTISVLERDRIASNASDASRPQVALASFTVADPDTAGTAFATYTYAVSDGRFEFVGNSLRLKAGVSLDYEAAASIALTVTATDTSGAGALSIARPVTIAVTNRDDIYEGTAGDDVAVGQRNVDKMYGYAGNDTLDGGDGDDYIDGGAGNDRLVGGLGNDRLYGGADADIVIGGAGDDSLYGETNAVGTFDRLYGGAGDDRLYGMDGDDWLVGGAGADRLEGWDGIDWVDYSVEDEGVAATAGVVVDLTAPQNNTGLAAGDTYYLVENVNGSDYADTLRGDAGANLLRGNAGNDVLEGMGGDDTLEGGAGNDTLRGGAGNDRPEGGDGDDIIYGDVGNDWLIGGAGNDTLYAEDGDDMLDGGTGNDILNGGLHNDTYLMSRTSGADTINNYDPSGSDVDVLGLQDSAGAIEDKDLWFERSGNDMIVSVIATTSSARIVNWYVMPGVDGSNYKIDFIIAGARYSKQINVEGLVGLMAGRTKPASAAERDAIMANSSYRSSWDLYWGNNRPPEISAIANQTIPEDGTITLAFNASDDLTPGNGLQIVAEVLSGAALVPVQNISWSAADGQGNRMLTIVPTSQMAGAATVRLTAVDAGGLRSAPRDFTVTVNAVADTPVIAGFAATSGNGGGALPLAVNVSFPDNDGSEIHELWITGVPAGVTLSAGTYDSAAATWKLTEAQAAGLTVNTPAGWSRDLALTLTARASENGQTAIATASTTMMINAAPSDMRLGGMSLAGPAVLEYTPSSNPAGMAIGVVAPVDPDAIERNRITTDFTQMPLRSTGEERVTTAAGPNGVGTVQVLETGQFTSSTDEAGGGVFDIGATGAIDTSKVYKYTIYMKAENNQPHYLYFGTRGNVQNAETGANDDNPYFWYGQGTGLVQDRWYRIEGYVLPGGSTLVPQGLFGGVYDTVTGAKVANTTTFRFRPGVADTGARFFSYYYQNNTGYSAQWYQPQIEQQDFSYALTDTAGGRFTIDPVTGLIRANGTAFDYESATSHNVAVRVTDGGGLSVTQVKTIAVTNVNEAPTTPTGPTSAFFDEAGLGANPGNPGTVLAGFAYSDPDAGDSPTLEFTSNPGGWFSIVGNTVRFAASLDFETLRANGYQVADFNGDGRIEAYLGAVAVRATDGRLASGVKAVDVYIQNVNEAPVVTSGGGMQILDETGLGNRPANAGAVVTTFGAYDPDGTAPAYRIVSNPGDWFYIDGNQLKLKSGLYFDYEPTGGTRNDWNGDGRTEVYVADVVVRATDGNLESGDIVVQFMISDVNERPNDLVLQASNVFIETTGGDSHAGLLQARFGVTDPDASGARLVIVGGNENGWFRVNEDGRHLQVTTANWSADYMRAAFGNAAFQYDTNGNGMLEARVARLTLAAEDPSGLRSNPFTYEVYIENKNEAPSTPSGGGWSFFDETGLGGRPASGGAVIANLSSSDPDGTAPTLQLVSNPNNWFYLEGGALKFASGFNHDFEYYRNSGAYGIYDWNGDGRLDAHIANVYVRATDGALNSPDTLVQVFISNVNEAPNAPSGGGWQFLDETGLGGRPANGGQVVASYGLSDPDNTTPALQLVTNPGGWFYIDGNTVRLNSGLNFDFESLRASGAYGINDWNGDGRLEAHIADVWVKANDGQADSPQTLTQVFISDVNERPNIAMEVNNLFTETTGGESHAWRLQTRFGLSDPDGTAPSLVILSGNENGWFQVNGNHIQVTGANWTADWIRGNKGAYGTNGDNSYDTNGNGLLETRVATLTVASRDSSGAQSDPYTYNIYIEDKNEAPAFYSGYYDWSVNENAGWYTYLGAVSGSDIDGPASQLRYNFATWDRYYDGNLGRYVTRSNDFRLVMDDNGNVWTNGNAPLDYDNGPNQFDYSIMIYDKSWGANNTYSYSTLHLRVADVDEQHSLSVSPKTIVEGIQLYTYQAANSLDVYNISAGLYDPDYNRYDNIRYRFSNGGQTDGYWTIDNRTGFITGPALDYEALVDVYEETWGYNPYTGEYESQGYQYTGQDPSRATFNLGVVAYNISNGQEAYATATINIANKDEEPSVSSYHISGGYNGKVIYQGPYEYWIKQDKNDGAIVQVYASDPDHGYISGYSISNYNVSEVIYRYGGSSEIDAYAFPSVYINSSGQISFSTPGDGEWEGGVKVGGTRRESTVTVTFNVDVTDSTGMTKSQPFTFRFLRRGASAPPIVLDLDGDGLELTAYDGSPVRFDMDRDGVRDQTGWAAADDGILALDRNGNGSIDDISEISFITDGADAVSDLEGLRAFDTDGDNFLDADDDRFAEFRVWRDANQDGVSQAEELLTLAEAGIERIGLTLTRNADEDADFGQNEVYGTAQFFRTDGSEGVVGDVFFAYDPSDVEKLAAPIIFDLDGDGKTVVALADSQTVFDMAGDGQLHRTAWSDVGDGFLVRDRNGNGLVDDIADISFIADKAGAKTDLEGLVAFDSNGDGILDGEDASFVGFNVWIDANANGRTDAGELRTLAEVGITAISLKGKATGQTAADRKNGQSVIFNTAAFSYADGRTGSLSDVGLAYDSTGLGLASAGTDRPEWDMQDFDRKSSKYLVMAEAGRVLVRPRNASGVFDPAAGQAGPATIMTFSDKTIGILSPIILDLDGDGVDFDKASNTKARFDMDGDGIADDTGWVGKGDGMLVIDRDGDGLITRANELSFVTERKDAGSALEGLAVLDANRDGKIDAADARFGELKVWKDTNRNGRTDEGELLTLAEAGIKEIGLKVSAVQGKYAKLGTNVLAATATFTKTNGQTRTLAEVALAFKPSGGGSKASQSIADANDVPAPTGALDRLDVRLAQMVQAMGSFGAQSSSSIDLLRPADTFGFDFHAATAA